MIHGFYTAKSGIQSHQDLLNVTANNIANASTPGYKAQAAAFSDLVYDEMAVGNGLQNGHGARLNAVSPDLSQGPVSETGGPLDVLIAGEGYFCVENSAGERFYTRNGSFQLARVDGVYTLVTAGGEKVLDRHDAPIVFKENGGAPVLAGPAATVAGDNAFQLAVVTFQNPQALTAEGNGLFRANAQSGAARLYEEARLVQGSLELSNVDLAAEMVKMIRAQRGLQFNAQVLKTADDLEGIANGLRG